MFITGLDRLYVRNTMVVSGLIKFQITSLSTYRRWLRDQATYNRKAKHGVPAEDL